MAFSQQEENILQQLIEAFQNGKTIADLPTAAGSNPFNMSVGVVDTDGETKRAALTTMLPYLEARCAYGIEFDTTISSPTCTRLGNMSLHRSLPIHNRMRGCLLNDDGEVVEYLPPTDWTTAVRDGSRGQVMVEIPMHYRKCETEGNRRVLRLSEHPLPGYTQVPQMYVSAYEASLERSTGKLCSVANQGTDYRGGGNNSSWDGTYRSLLGRPVTSINRIVSRNAARKRKANDTRWNAYLYEAHKTLYWLFVTEYATLNSQAAYNAQLTSEGYRQGGLGAGVTDWDRTSWKNFNGYNPFVPCGHTDSLGNGTGVVPYTLNGSDGGELKTTNVPRYRGVENPFGHILKWSDGINIRISPTLENGGDNLSKIFVCPDPSKFSDSGYTGYKHVGNEDRHGGYVKEVVFGKEAEIMPSAVGAGSTSFFCDYHYTNIPTSEALRGVLFGGDAADSSYGGFACVRSSEVPSYAYSSSGYGSRLTFIPKII